MRLRGGRYWEFTSQLTCFLGFRIRRNVMTKMAFYLDFMACLKLTQRRPYSSSLVSTFTYRLPCVYVMLQNGSSYMQLFCFFFVCLFVFLKKQLIFINYCDRHPLAGMGWPGRTSNGSAIDNLPVRKHYSNKRPTGIPGQTHQYASRSILCTSKASELSDGASGIQHVRCFLGTHIEQQIPDCAVVFFLWNQYLETA